MKKPKLLFVSAIAPIPLNSGGATRVYQTITELGKHFQLDVITFKSESAPEIKKLQQFLDKTTHHFELLNLSKNYFLNSFLTTAQPYWFYPWYSSELTLLINQLHQKHNYDAIMVDFTQLLFVSKYLPADTLKIFSAHDVSVVSFFRRMSEVRKIDQFIGQLYRLLEIYWYEKMYLPNYDLVLAMSAHDATLLKKIYNLRTILVAPNGISTIAKSNKKYSKSLSPIKLGYIGSFNHPPNQFSFSYFVAHIAPLLEERGLKYTFYLAGNNTTEQVASILQSHQATHLKSRFVNLGVVPSPNVFFDQIDVQVAPIFSGSGTRLKILEAAGYHTHTITTRLGAEGLPFIDDKNLITLAENPTEFADAIEEFASHPVVANSDASLTKLLWKNMFADLAAKIKSMLS
jgi:polysaccharide biosynthesis protein PslH